MLAASRISPWEVHTLGVSICKCRSCCRREFQALSFAAVNAAGKGEECISPLHFLSAFGEGRGKPFLSQSLTSMIACFVMLFTALTAFFLALLGS